MHLRRAKLTDACRQPIVAAACPRQLSAYRGAFILLALSVGRESVQEAGGVGIGRPPRLPSPSGSMARRILQEGGGHGGGVGTPGLERRRGNQRCGRGLNSRLIAPHKRRWGVCPSAPANCPAVDPQEGALGPILETDNVRSPSPENDEGASQVSDEEGGLEIVEDGNSSDGEQGEDESNGAKENDDGGDEAGDGDEAEGVEEEGEEEKPEVQPQVEEEESLQMNPQEEETGSLPVEDTPASPTEEDSSFMHDAPASPPC
ncbi:hypothetical protein MRX96_024573 [Rhipicephalus microplus]